MDPGQERYSRQVLFRGIGREGQDRLAASHVAVVGCGALGSVGAELLVRAGVGRVSIIDRDYVEISNLQRQSLFTDADARSGIPKALAAASALRAVNPEIEILASVADLTADNIAGLLAGSDLILDGSDNFEVRYLVNDYAVREGIPWIYGAALGSYGLAAAIVPGRTPCLRCLFEPPRAPGSGESCETSGILAPVIHVIASHQVTQALKILVDAPLEAGLLQVDVWENDWRWIRGSERVPGCPCCGERRFEFLLGSGKTSTTRLCGRHAVQVSPGPGKSLDLARLARQLEGVVEVICNEHLLRFRQGRFEVALFRDGRAVITGTDDPAEARSIYARFVGN